jgi:predicted metallopeptidase
MQLCRLEESRRERKHKVSKKNKNTGKILEKMCEYVRKSKSRAASRLWNIEQPLHTALSA